MISHSFISFSAVQKIWATHCILTCNNVLFVQEKYQPTVKPDSSLSGCNVITPGEVAYILQAYWYYFFIDCFTLCSTRGEAREVVIKSSKACCTILTAAFFFDNYSCLRFLTCFCFIWICFRFWGVHSKIANSIFWPYSTIQGMYHKHWQISLTHR